MIISKQINPLTSIKNCWEGIPYFFTAVTVQEAHFQTSSQFSTRRRIFQLFAFFGIGHRHFDGFLKPTGPRAQLKPVETTTTDYETKSLLRTDEIPHSNTKRTEYANGEMSTHVKIGRTNTCSHFDLTVLCARSARKRKHDISSVNWTGRVCVCTQTVNGSNRSCFNHFSN